MWNLNMRGFNMNTDKLLSEASVADIMDMLKDNIPACENNWKQGLKNTKNKNVFQLGV